MPCHLNCLEHFSVQSIFHESVCRFKRQAAGCRIWYLVIICISSSGDPAVAAKIKCRQRIGPHLLSVRQFKALDETDHGSILDGTHSYTLTRKCWWVVAPTSFDAEILRLTDGKLRRIADGCLRPPCLVAAPARAHPPLAKSARWCVKCHCNCRRHSAPATWP